MKPRPAVIACDVFEKELHALAGPQPPWVCIRFLEMGLHDQPDGLRRTLQSVIDGWSETLDCEAILLAYGLCGNGLIGLEARKHRLIVPRAHDCISILLGGAEVQEAVLRENPGTYFYSPGWIREGRVPGPDRAAYAQKIYSERYPDDPERVEELVEMDAEAFAHQDCAAYVDLTNDAAAEAYCQRCARHLNWRFQRLQGDPSMLRSLLYGPWPEARFLEVPPGHRIERGHGPGIVFAVPSGEGEGAL